MHDRIVGHQMDGLISLDMENVFHISSSGCTETHSQQADGWTVVTHAGEMGVRRDR